MPDPSAQAVRRAERNKLIAGAERKHTLGDDGSETEAPIDEPVSPPQPPPMHL